MTKRVVHRFEAVEVETKDDARAAVARNAGQVFVQALTKQRTIRQVGQGVVARHVRDLGLGPLAFGYILVRRNPSATRYGVVQDGENASVPEFQEPLGRHTSRMNLFARPTICLRIDDVSGGNSAVENPPERRSWLRQL